MIAASLSDAFATNDLEGISRAFGETFTHKQISQNFLGEFR